MWENECVWETVSIKYIQRKQKKKGKCEKMRH